MSDDLDPRLVEDTYPFQDLVGFRMTAWREDFARFELPIAPKLANRYGIVHGGVYAVLLDTVMGYACCYTGDPANRQLVMTLSLTTNFVSQAKGAVLIGEARRVGGGRRTAYAEATIRDELGTLVTTGSGVFRYRGR
jgi:uncharacterized protein (TIGR00369 family)